MKTNSKLKSGKSATPVKPAPKVATIFEVGEYKGNAICSIFDAAKYDSKADDETNRSALIVAFGVRKAKAILHHVEDIRGFVVSSAK